jgi:hypothetical protein
MRYEGSTEYEIEVVKNKIAEIVHSPRFLSNIQPLNIIILIPI